MNPSQNRRCLDRPGRQIVPMLSLLLGLCLQSITSSADQADAAATPGQARQSSSPSNSRTLRQQVAPMPPAADVSPQPTPKAAPKSKLAIAAEDSAPPRKARPPSKQKRKSDTKRMQQALAQTVAEREVAERARLKAETIKELLDRAQRDYAEGRLIEPANNNAAHRYKEILVLDPTQLEALAGAKRIVGILAAEAEHVAIAGDQARTQQYIAQIRALQPQDGSLLELDARLNALLASPVVLSARQQQRYNRSAQRIDNAYDVLKNQPLDLRTLDQAIDEYDHAAALVAQAPGLPTLKDRIILAFPAATRGELANDDSKRALRVVAIARQRGWFTPELEVLERQAKEGIAAKQQIPSPRQQR